MLLGWAIDETLPEGVRLFGDDRGESSRAEAVGTGGQREARYNAELPDRAGSAMVGRDQREEEGGVQYEVEREAKVSGRCVAAWFFSETDPPALW